MEANETLDYYIKHSWHAIANYYNQAAAPHRLTQATGFVLLNINSKAGTPATKIAPLMGMKATSLSRVLKSMEESDLICRKKDKTDGRLVKIHLTSKGKSKKKIAKKVVKEFNEFLISRIDESKIETYKEVMSDILQLTEEYNQKLLS